MEKKMSATNENPIGSKLSEAVDLFTGEIAVSQGDAMTALYADLALFQEELDSAVKDNKGHHGFYATIASCSIAIKKAAKGKGLAFLFRSIPWEGGAHMELIVTHRGGGLLTLGSLMIPASGRTPAQFGGACTYARRYLLGNLMLSTSLDAEENEKHLHAEVSISPAEITAAFLQCDDITQIGETLNRLARVFSTQRPALQAAATARKNALATVSQLRDAVTDEEAA